MAVNAWTPLHEPIFLDIEVGIVCSLLQIPRIPREVSFEEIPFTHSNFESMAPKKITTCCWAILFTFRDQ